MNSGKNCHGTWTNGKEIANKEIRSAMIALITASWGIGSKAMADLLVPAANSALPKRANSNPKGLTIV